jgi:hypothetical protein
MISLFEIMISLLPLTSPHVGNRLINHSIFLLHHPQANHGPYLHGLFGSVAVRFLKDNDL